jgi:CubicO group peptidase (beta-lactamase class C family)
LELLCKEYILEDTIYHSELPNEKVVFPSEKGLSSGEVQDEKARFLKDPVGHAGIFSSINDLMIYSELWLNNSFNLNQELLNLALNGKQESDDFLNNLQDFSGSKIYPETYGYVWRRGRYYPHSNLRNHAGHTGCMIHLDFENKEALIYTTTYHYPFRDITNKQRFILWNWGVWNSLES